MSKVVVVSPAFAVGSLVLLAKVATRRLLACQCITAHELRELEEVRDPVLVVSAQALLDGFATDLRR